MLSFIAQILGSLMKFIYDSLVNNFTEPSNISFYAISIILMTVLVSLITILKLCNKKCNNYIRKKE